MARLQIKLISQGAEVTDRLITKDQFAEVGVVAPGDLRWYRGAALILEDPDESLVEYFKERKDEFRVRELKTDAAEDKPSG